MKQDLLIKGPCTLFQDYLAMALGLSKAIVLQKFVFLLSQGSGKEMNGQKWLYNTSEEWQKNYFPYLSVETVKRTIRELEVEGYLVSCQPEGGISRRKYIAIGEGMCNLLDSEILKIKIEGKLNDGIEGVENNRMSGGKVSSKGQILPLPLYSNTNSNTYSTTIPFFPATAVKASKDEETQDNLQPAPELFPSQQAIPSPTPNPTLSPSEKERKVSQKERKRNELVDFLASVDGTDPLKATMPALRQAGVALATIRQVDPDVTMDMLRRCLAAYKRKYPNCICTSTALAKHWGALVVNAAKADGPYRCATPEEMAGNGQTPF